MRWQVSALPVPGTLPSVWKPLKLGAGGYICGIDISADGSTKVIRTDTYGAYRLVGSVWKQLVTDASMPAIDRLPWSDIDVFEIAVAPNTPSRVYMAWNKSVYRSDNAGDSWTVTGLTGKDFAEQSGAFGYRYSGRKMIVDPANPDVVYFGVQNDGLYVTTNGGTSWALVSTAQIPKSLHISGYLGMAFDPSGGTTSGKTNNIFICSTNQGLYRSTDAGATFTNLTGGPDFTNGILERSTVDTTNGVFFACFSVGGLGSPTLWRYTPPSTWAQVITVANYAPHGVAVDPNNHSHVIVVRASGEGIGQSTDGGSTWDIPTYIFSSNQTASDIPWLAYPDAARRSAGDIMWDPVVANKLWNVDGTGVWTATISAGATATWNSLSAGIEQLVVNAIIAPPGGNPLVAVWDRGMFVITDRDNYPSTYKPSNAFDACWDVDYAGGTPGFIVGNFGDNQGLSLLAGYSQDGGNTWTTYPTMPLNAASPYTYGFGSMQVSTDTQHIVWVGGNSQWPYYTTNRGTTWTACAFTGLTQGVDEGGFDANYSLTRHVLTSDKVTSNVFYCAFSSAADATKRGFYKSTDGGANWTRQGPDSTTTTNIADGTVGSTLYWSGFNCRLQAAPGNAGHLWFTSGQDGAGPDSLTPAPRPFIRSTDGGVTWSVVANVLEVYKFGFGLGNGSYPSIFIVGWVNSVYGVWRSDDQAATWVNIGTWPYGLMDNVTAVSGDMNVYGRCYVGTRGSGAVYRSL